MQFALQSTDQYSNPDLVDAAHPEVRHPDQGEAGETGRDPASAEAGVATTEG